MMLLAASLLFAQAASAAPDPLPEPAEDRIVVVGERLRSIEANVTRDREGSWHCSLSASTGSAWVDDRLCRLTTGCVRDANGNRDRIERCVTRRRAGIMDEFRAAIERGEA